MTLSSWAQHDLAQSASSCGVEGSLPTPTLPSQCHSFNMGKPTQGLKSVRENHLPLARTKRQRKLKAPKGATFVSPGRKSWGNCEDRASPVRTAPVLTHTLKPPPIPVRGPSKGRSSMV